MTSSNRRARLRGSTWRRGHIKCVSRRTACKNRSPWRSAMELPVTCGFLFSNTGVPDQKPMPLTRRSLFRFIPFGAAMLRARAADMIIRSARPEDFEMSLDGFNTWITPVERFFVRTHVYTPRVDAAQWQLRVEGEVSTPLSLSLRDLREFPRAELVSVLECAGNGRGLFEPPVAGLQWKYGGVGNARWTGVRLMDVLNKAGYKSSAT